MEEETIFQVRINRKDGGFELVKKGLTNFEQAGFQLYLESYLEYMKDLAKDEIGENYFESEEDSQE